MAAAWDRLLNQELEMKPEKVATPQVPKKPAVKPAPKRRRRQTLVDVSDVPENPYMHEFRKPILVTPFSKEERARIELLYRKNIALIKFMTGRMASKYGAFVEVDTIKSLSEVAFLKSARVWDPRRGTLSTTFAFFFNGEILHWIRAENWAYKATYNKRALGCKARSLKNKGLSTAEVMQRLEIDAEQLKDALLASNGVDHDIKGFDLHFSPYLTPMERLEEEEETEEMRERLIALSIERFDLTEDQAKAFVKQKLLQVEIFGKDKVA